MRYRLEGQSADGYMDDVEVVDASDHDKAIDDIERRVNEALKLIEDIQGIEVIDECKEKLEALASDLY